MSEVAQRIKNCKTMSELDNLRLETVQEMKRAGQSGYKLIQKVFVKQKNKLLRIPLSERN